MGCVAVVAIGLLVWASIAESRARRAQQVADEKQKQADTNAKQAVAEAKRADEMLERSEHLLYASQIRAAEQSYLSGNAYRCRELLDACRWDYRGFDHRELYAHVRPGHSDSVWSVSFSPDGKQLVSGSADGTIKVWDGSRRRAMLPIFAGQAAISAARASLDETLIVSGNENGLVHVWDASSGQLMTDELTAFTSPVKAVAVRPFVWRIDDSNSMDMDRVPGAVKKDHKTQQVAAGSSDLDVVLWDLDIRNRRVIGSSETRLPFDPDQTVWRLNYSSDGTRIAAGGSGGLVRIWDTKTHERLASFKAHGSYVKSLQFTDDNSKLITSGLAKAVEGKTKETEFKVWDLTTPKPAAVPLFDNLPGRWISGLAIHDNLLATGNSAGQFLLYDHSQRKVLHSIQGHDPVDGKDRAVQCIALSLDGTLLATGSEDHSIRLWNIETGERRAILSEHTSAVNSLQFYQHKARDEFDKAELRLVSSGSDGTIRVWLVDEILKYAPVPVPGKLAEPRVEVSDSAQGLTSFVDHTADVMDAAASTDEASEPLLTPVQKHPAEPLAHRPLAVVVGLLAVFSVFLTLAARHRHRTRLSAPAVEIKREFVANE